MSFTVSQQAVLYKGKGNRKQEKRVLVNAQSKREFQIEDVRFSIVLKTVSNQLPFLHKRKKYLKRAEGFKGISRPAAELRLFLSITQHEVTGQQ